MQSKADAVDDVSDAVKLGKAIDSGASKGFLRRFLRGSKGLKEVVH